MRYYWNNYEDNSIGETKNRMDLFFRLRETNPDIILHTDGIETTTQLHVGNLPLFVALADSSTIDALKPSNKGGRRKATTSDKATKLGKVAEKQIARKQAYIAYLESQLALTKKQIDEITKKGIGTLDTGR